MAGERQERAGGVVGNQAPPVEHEPRAASFTIKERNGMASRGKARRGQDRSAAERWGEPRNAMVWHGGSGCGSEGSGVQG